MAATSFTIGRLAAETGCKIPTIRYYEKIGLMPAPDRSPGNTRRYSRAHTAHLVFIQHCRELGFSQDTIRELVDLTGEPDRSCASVTRIAREQLASVEHRIARLTVLKEELERLIRSCTGGRVGQCEIVEALADHDSLGAAP